jgi:hypothetical protein
LRLSGHGNPHPLTLDANGINFFGRGEPIYLSTGDEFSVFSSNFQTGRYGGTRFSHYGLFEINCDGFDFRGGQFNVHTGAVYLEVGSFYLSTIDSYNINADTYIGNSSSSVISNTAGYVISNNAADGFYNTAGNRFNISAGNVMSLGSPRIDLQTEDFALWMSDGTGSDAVYNVDTGGVTVNFPDPANDRGNEAAEGSMRMTFAPGVARLERYDGAGWVPAQWS